MSTLLAFDLCAMELEEERHSRGGEEHRRSVRCSLHRTQRCVVRCGASTLSSALSLRELLSRAALMVRSSQ